MSDITARGSFNGQELKDIPVLNPGDRFGKTWLLEVGGSYWPLFLVVEADSVSDAIDELADNEKYGHHIAVPPEDLGDYPRRRAALRPERAGARPRSPDGPRLGRVRLPLLLHLPRRRPAERGHEADRLLET